MDGGAIAPVEDEAAADDDAAEIEDGSDDEEEPSKYLCSPCQPSLQEEEEHRCTHCPFRSWCRFCIMGRAVGQPHKSSESRSEVPRAGLDYFFITKGSIKMRQELEVLKEKDGEAKLESQRKNGVITKCILVRCWESKAVFAHVVPCKGADEGIWC